ncbi:hypothetical protein POM88_038682 [Heracleum sosnowskyi]|uniref:Ubiquitin-like protease family profile domain-containing protein n=1 Tax=Heracleum sosnowskyi TaxID=360622 RepID=A0AAD8M746_9APIA|nr:hypothetical protein POM88_038682 [Heracleum sosnowskyi]
MIFFKQSDLDELRNERRYLSDVFIEFYFTYLSSIHPSDSISFVPPTISYLLASLEDEDDIEDCVKPLELPSKDLIFFPVNNGGLHWSLLVYNRQLNLFAHHDSLGGLNDEEARELYDAVKDCVHESESFRYKVGFRNKRRLMEGNSSQVPRYITATTPRQTNGYDCGLYVMATAKAICKWFCAGGVREKTWEREVEKLDDNVGITMRPLVLQLIRDAKEGRLGSVSCTIEEERCVDRVEELNSEEIELYQFWADFDDPVDPKTFKDDLPTSIEAGNIVSGKTNNRITPLIKVDAFNDSEEMEHRFPSCDSTSASSSSMVEEHKPVKDASIVGKEEMENTPGTATSDCRTSGVKREYLSQWPPEGGSTIEANRGPLSFSWRNLKEKKGARRC